MIKIFFTALILLASLSLSAAAKQTSQDPFEKLEYFKLKNGVEVFLAPSAEANLTMIRVEVDVGYDVETRENIGVTHLLEHVLFRDEKLKDEMSYLQLIKEKGGEANGQTSARETIYYGHIPAKDGKWLLNTIGNLILKPSITDDYVTKEKRTVELERGKPSPIDLAFGFDIKNYLYPKYLRQKDFWQSEFGVTFSYKFSLTQEQLSTQRLTLAQVKQHYDDYYIPANMRVFVAGKFVKNEIMKVINSEWGSLPVKDGKKMPGPEKPNPSKTPYEVVALNPASPYIYLGTKFWDINQTEALILDVYSESVAHRLMKELRNKKGQAYTVRGVTSGEYNFGYTFVEFETPKENFSENLKLVQGYLDNEAEEGGITDEQVNEAIELYMKKYFLAGAEASDMMGLLYSIRQDLKLYNSHVSPMKILMNIKPSEVRDILKKFYKPNQRYGFFYKPPLFFYYDSIVLSIIVFLISFFTLRRVLTQNFKHDQVRWIRKVKFPPLKSLEFSVGIIALIVFLHIQFVMKESLYSISIWQASLILSAYVRPIIDIILFLVVVQGIVSFLPRKLMVINDQLMIKSLSYFSKKIPLVEIQSIESVRCIGYPLPLTRWLVSVRHRFFFFNQKFWKKGLLINLKSGKSYYFGVNDAEQSKHELDGFLSRLSKSENHLRVS
ncbi:MAG: hypothetical protein A2Z20_12530 [Bdellovibrionales bacterium RBG_16_40_8]|nr:MAG: hypothetical protein A2Z20_12530 [Bdellovibrionales bacterium RBG_16_40_8]